MRGFCTEENNNLIIIGLCKLQLVRLGSSSSLGSPSHGLSSFRKTMSLLVDHQSIGER